MPPTQQLVLLRFGLLGYRSLLLMCLLLITFCNLVAQPVDTTVAASAEPQTNAVRTEVVPATPDLMATNLPAPDTNAFQGMTLPAPYSFTVSPEATIGTGHLASPIIGTSSLTGPAPLAPESQGAGALWHSGNIAIHAVLTETMLYGTGVDFSPGNQTATFVNEFTPGMTVNLGKNWVFNYAPTVVDYSSDKFQDTVNHSESLAGSTTFRDWSFGLTQFFAKESTPLVETGEQTDTELFSGALTAGRQLSSDFSARLTLGADYRATKDFDDVATWTGAASVYYSPMQQLSFNLSFSGGYDQINVGSDMTFESLQAGLTFHPRNKLTLSLSAGAEDLQFINPSAPSLLSPIFNASLSYKATRSTSITLNAGETVSPSFFANQVVTTKSVAAMLQQQLTEKLSLSLDGSYTSEPYTSIEPGPLPKFYLGLPPSVALASVRSDTTESFTARISYLIGRRITTSVFYTLSENSTGQSNFKYTSAQEGLTLTYRY